MVWGTRGKRGLWGTPPRIDQKTRENPQRWAAGPKKNTYHRGDGYPKQNPSRRRGGGAETKFLGVEAVR